MTTQPARRKKRGQLDALPDLTPPARAFALDEGCDSGDEDAEYHGAYTIRTAKLRPFFVAKAWLQDRVLHEEYQANVLIIGFTPNVASEQASPYEIMVDCLYLVEHWQVREDAHNLLTKAHHVPHLSDTDSVPDGAKVFYVANWPDAIPLNKIRDPEKLCLLSDGPMKPNGRYLGGYVELSGTGSASSKKNPKKYRRHISVGDGGFDELVQSLPQHIQDMLPDIGYHVKAATPFVESAEASASPIFRIKRDVGGMIERFNVGPGSPLSMYTSPTLIMAVLTPQGEIFAIDGSAEIVAPEGESAANYGGMGYRIYRPGELLRPSRALTATHEQSLRAELALEPYKRRYFNGERDLVPDADAPLVPVREEALQQSTNIFLTEHHMVHLLRTSIPPHRIYTFETCVLGKRLHGLYPSSLHEMKEQIQKTLTPTCDLVSLHHMLRVQTMIQSKDQRGASVVRVRIAAGILDLTVLGPDFLDMDHSFETGTRHLTLEKWLLGKRKLADVIGFDSFTAAVPITQPLDGMRGPHIGVLPYDVKHRFAFNPTSSMIELDLKPSWFTSDGRYEGGVKRPDPPDDGRSYVYHLDKRKWLMHGAPEGSDAPRSATALSTLMTGKAPPAFL